MNTNLYTGYLAFTDTVARYPTAFEKPYLALGLVDETCDELVTAINRSHMPDVFLELGDSQWYAARLCRVFGFDYAELIASAKTAYEGVGGYSLSTIGEALSITAGKIAGRVKKFLRDGERWDEATTANFRNVLRDYLVQFFVRSFVMLDLLWVVDSKLGNYDACLHANVAKLGGRLERGTIHGDGDHR